MVEKRSLTIDAHTHFSSSVPAKDEKGPKWWGIDETLQHMDEVGVDMAMVSSTKAMGWMGWKKEKLGGNEEVIEAIRKYPNRFIGGFVPDVDADANVVKNQIETIFHEHNFKALKLQPWFQGRPANHPQLYPIYEIASKLRIPILIHTGGTAFCTPLQVADVAKTFDVIVIMGHMGRYDQMFDVIPAARLSENVYADTAGQYILPMIEKFVKEIGPDRVLFGSDFPVSKMDVERQVILDLNISEEDKRLILGENAARIFRVK